MAISIKKRRNIVWNTCLFAILAPVYLLIAQSLNSEVSILNWDYSKLLSQKTQLILGSGVLVAILVSTVKRFSLVALRGYLLLLVILLLQVLFEKFNKLTLFVCFTFFIQAYFFLAFWKEELQSSFYNPEYSAFDYKLAPRPFFECRLITKKGKVLKAELTNWDEIGVFCRSVEETKLSQLKQVKRLEVDFEGKKFTHSCRVVSYDKRTLGVGLEFLGLGVKGHEEFNWTDLFAILYERGIVKELLV